MRSKLFLALFATTVFTVPAAGQVRIIGRVIDDLTERPLSQTRVSILKNDEVLLAVGETLEDGTFEFVVDNTKSIRISARRFGYQANKTPILYFDGRKFFQVEIRLDPDAILLAPLEVIAWSERPMNALHEGYKRRLNDGFGTFITREDVERRNPAMVTDLLRDLPGVTVTGSGSGLRPAVRIGRSAGYNCATQIFVDGFLMNRRGGLGDDYQPQDFRIDDLVSPAAIEGIEIYRGLSTVPAEFLNPDADCGVIAIWTRRGGDS
jgi:hypothetical protein